MAEENSVPQEGTFYAQVDSISTMQDYRPYFRCVRLVGVLAGDFKNESFNGRLGCPVFIIDVAWEFLWPRKLYLHWPHPPRFWPADLLEEEEEEEGKRWIELKFFRSSTVSGVYAYEAFTDAGPQYLKISHIGLAPGPEVDPPEEVRDASSIVQLEDTPSVELTAFHVGQGMCSLLSGPAHDHGYLLDAGAGTPVLRESYRSKTLLGGAPFKNDLEAATRHLKRITALLSHADCDHWRVLEWDTHLLSKVDNIYLPKGRPSLVFNSNQTKLKTKGLGDTSFELGQCKLRVLRSEPSKKDKNGHCLVVHATCNETRHALLPGDYVYHRMLSDERNDGAIAALAKVPFDAIVVPHHGDEASAENVFSPRIKGQSIAFFSAGDHGGYGHPTLPSIDAHALMEFVAVDMLTPNIVRRILLP